MATRTHDIHAHRPPPADRSFNAGIAAALAQCSKQTALGDEPEFRSTIAMRPLRSHPWDDVASGLARSDNAVKMTAKKRN